MGEGVLFIPEPRCPCTANARPLYRVVVAFTPRGWLKDAVLVSHRFRHSGITRPHRGLAHAHPFHLLLLRVGRMARPSLGRYPQLRTPPLPATHVRMSDRSGTLT